MRFLVTGGAGFIGSNLVDSLLKIGEVIVIDNFSSGKVSNLTHATDKKVEIVKMTITNYSEIRPYIKDIDIVFHLAAVANVVQSIKDPIHCNLVNVNGTLNVLSLAREFNVGKVIFSSSSSIYGDTDKVPISEDVEQKS